MLIIVINEALYYVRKLGNSLINPNQLQSYGNLVWNNPFDSNKELRVETEDSNTIYLIENGTKIGFYSISLTNHELQLLNHVQLTSKFHWNPDRVNIGEVRDDHIKEKYTDYQCKYLRDTDKGDYLYQDPKAYESITH